MFQGKPSGDLPFYIQYEFDAVYKLHEMLVWNYNVAFELILGFGFKDTTVEYSVDGAEWTVLSAVEFAQATAKPDYAANTTVEFGGVPAKYVRLTVDSSYDIGMLPEPQFGLSEVCFMCIPAQARESQPAVGATGVAVESAINWRAGREAVTHDVYLGMDPNVLVLAASARSGWTEWLIPYSELSGINLSKVSTVYVGVGDRNNPTAGGAGTVFIDDLGFGHPAPVVEPDEAVVE